jgi:hypothetical protein
MHVPMIPHFALVDFRNDNRVFGIKDEDRFSHIYIIGKTGTGKSTLLETMGDPGLGTRQWVRLDRAARRSC